MFRKLDRWIGRHMSAKRWMTFWGAVMIGSMAGICATLPSYWAIAWTPMYFIGAILFSGNADRRLK